MRMRRKSNLDERIALCRDYVLNNKSELLDSRVSLGDLEKIDWEKEFGNTNKIYLEIGCGKGGFVFDMAEKYPDINFIAIERITNVLIEGAEKAERIKTKNIRFLNTNAKYLPRYLHNGILTKIYLNFSNPLPRKPNEKQRLTHSKFLDIYYDFLNLGGEIALRTDDKDFFEYSKAQFLASGKWRLDLVNYDMKNEIKTEHEQMFIEKGKAILGLVAVKI